MKRVLTSTYVHVLWMGVCCLFISSCKQSPQMITNSNYKVMQVARSDKSLSRLYTATIQGRQDVEVRPQVSGTITNVCIAEGAVVRKGETLFIIDQVPYKAALQIALANVESAEANVASAQLTADSKQALFADNVVSSFDLQTALNTLRAQKAALARAKADELNARNNYSYTEVKSPSNGIVGMIPYRVGALVNGSMQTPLVTVSDDADMFVYFSMTESQILELSRQNGTLTNAMQAMPDVQLRLSDGTLYPEPGKVDAISGIIDASTGAIRVRATFPNSQRILRSGGAGNIVLPYNKTGCIVVPQAATYEIQDKLYVYKVVEGKAKSTPVKAFEVNDGKEYIIEEGLSVGDQIIAEGAGLVREGASVTPASTPQTTQSNQ